MLLPLLLFLLIMVLSRIWSAFILVALAVALGRFIFESDQQQIFTQMVTGKSGDTTYVQVMDAAAVPAVLQQELAAVQGPVKWEGRQVAGLEDGAVKLY